MNKRLQLPILAEQRRQDFAAEAANDRLARLATADRTPLVAPAGPHPAARARQPSS